MSADNGLRSAWLMHQLSADSTHSSSLHAEKVTLKRHCKVTSKCPNQTLIHDDLEVESFYVLHNIFVKVILVPVSDFESCFKTLMTWGQKVIYHQVWQLSKNTSSSTQKKLQVLKKQHMFIIVCFQPHWPDDSKEAMLVDQLFYLTSHDHMNIFFFLKLIIVTLVNL